ncbi:MAG: acetyl-coenzyme A synthetase N-terminal domain-containing protein [Cycloclasticus sp.]
MGQYSEKYVQSLNEPEVFWAEAAKAVDWNQPWACVLDGSEAPYYRCFFGAKLNTCYNALDRLVKNGRADEVIKELVALMREKIGSVAAFKLATKAKRLPKTRSGKILRGTMRSMADGTEHKVPATIDNPTTLGEIAENLTALGYPKSV